MVGWSEGEVLGALEGIWLGDKLGTVLGFSEGSLDGEELASGVGRLLGCSLGS